MYYLIVKLFIQPINLDAALPVVQRPSPKLTQTLMRPQDKLLNEPAKDSPKLKSNINNHHH